MFEENPNEQKIGRAGFLLCHVLHDTYDVIRGRKRERERERERALTSKEKERLTSLYLWPNLNSRKKYIRIGIWTLKIKVASAIFRQKYPFPEIKTMFVEKKEGYTVSYKLVT